MKRRPRVMRLRMLLVPLLFAAVLMGPPPLAAQGGAVSSSGAAAQSSTGDTQSGDLPVSLDRIRAGLKRQATDSLLRRVEIPPDFRIQILEQQKINDMLSKLDFKHLSGPAPAGGLYGYEQQQRLFNSVDHPLVQPYAAFSGGELITIAIENLIARYFGGRIVNAITEAERARAERAAREEVDRAITDYCAARADRGDIQLCTSPRDR
jgi:hypothetical protein